MPQFQFTLNISHHLCLSFFVRHSQAQKVARGTFTVTFSNFTWNIDTQFTVFCYSLKAITVVEVSLIHVHNIHTCTQYRETVNKFKRLQDIPYTQKFLPWGNFLSKNFHPVKSSLLPVGQRARLVKLKSAKFFAQYKVQAIGENFCVYSTFTVINFQ